MFPCTLLLARLILLIHYMAALYSSQETRVVKLLHSLHVGNSESQPVDTPSAKWRRECCLHFVNVSF